MIAYIEILRAIAVMLITNSHFKGIYPSDILSFGGGMGVALFYMISGYLLTNINQKTKFIQWYKKRLLRLYIPLWIFDIIAIFIGFIKINSTEDIILTFLFPGTWFSASMVICYPIYFLWVKYMQPKENKNVIIETLAVLVGIFLILFVIKPNIAVFSLGDLTIKENFKIETPYLISQIIWMMCMVIGLDMKQQRSCKNGRELLYFGLSMMCVVLFFGTKLLTSGGVRVNLQILLAPAYIGFAYFLFRSFMGFETHFQDFLLSKLGKVVRVISLCSLEIYYVQFAWINIFYKLPFPVNWLLIVIAVGASAYALHFVSNLIYQGIQRSKKDI